jgi:DNA-binding CsgD family transcriptional regulator
MAAYYMQPDGCMSNRPCRSWEPARGPRRIAPSGVESLTPSERRVAELAAEGSKNREIA